MTYYIISSNELTHYGVKGMKWGVRHDYKPVGKSRNSALNYSKTKKLLKYGAIAAGSALAIAGGVYLAKSGKLTPLINKGRSFYNSKLSSKAAIAKLNSDVFTGTIDKQVVQSMNPLQDKTNCAFTSIGYVTNKITGKSVTATANIGEVVPGYTVEGIGAKPEIFLKVFNNVKLVKTNPKASSYWDCPKSLSKSCLDIKDNSFGALHVVNPMGFGHFVNYEKKNGVMRIIDCQGQLGFSINKVSDWEKAGFRLYQHVDCSNATLKSEGTDILNKLIKIKGA